MSRVSLLSLLALLACRQDIGLTESARCDGRKQQSEDYVDQAFDRDGDGYFDGANPDCQAVYGMEDLDCDDSDPEVHPDASELVCDGKDNDCDDTTPDEIDADGDGFLSCEDCNDNLAGVNPGVLEIDCNGIDDDCDPTTLDGIDYDGDGYDECEDCDEQRANVNPGGIEVFCDGLDNDCNPGTEDSPDADFDGVGECDDCDDRDATRSPDLDEVCDDGVDNNCDGFVDEDCGFDVDVNGQWDIDDILYQCADTHRTDAQGNPIYALEIDLGSFVLAEANGNITVTGKIGESSRTATQPGEMRGLLVDDGTFSASNSITGSCTETYEISGTFVTEDSFEATFRATFTGWACFDCTSQVWSVTGSRL
ncbi:MAG: putative metal-binding motif-containing protein [Alphaproteobacteria bacterium]|nr:putative metal-binding motif-containing protein [Alphaproteobacteria bacterium]